MKGHFMQNGPQAVPSVQQDSTEFARGYLVLLSETLANVPIEPIAQVISLLEKAYDERRTIFIAGNGGSSSTASHMASDLSKTILCDEKECHGFRTIALSDNTPLVTAWANDVSYHEIFSGQLKSMGQSGDILILISGSGNSKNLVHAAEMAREMGLTVIGFLGKGGGVLKSLVHLPIVVPSDDYGPIEDAHLALNHLITAYFKRKIKTAGS